MTVNLTRIYTRLGDGGETHLGDMSRVPEDPPADRGLRDGRRAQRAARRRARAAAGCRSATPSWLRRVQNDLFDVGADISVPHGGDRERLRLAAGADGVARGGLRRGQRRAAEPLKSFVLPGGTPGGRAAARLPHGLPARRAAHDRLRRGRQRRVRALPQPALRPAVHPLPRRQPGGSGEEPLWQPGAGQSGSSRPEGLFPPSTARCASCTRWRASSRRTGRGSAGASAARPARRSARRGRRARAAARARGAHRGHGLHGFPAAQGVGGRLAGAQRRGRPAARAQPGAARGRARRRARDDAARLPRRAGRPPRRRDARRLAPPLGGRLRDRGAGDGDRGRAGRGPGRAVEPASPSAARPRRARVATGLGTLGEAIDGSAAGRAPQRALDRRGAGAAARPRAAAARPPAASRARPARRRRRARAGRSRPRRPDGGGQRRLAQRPLAVGREPPDGAADVGVAHAALEQHAHDRRLRDVLDGVARAGRRRLRGADVAPAGPLADRGAGHARELTGLAGEEVPVRFRPSRHGRSYPRPGLPWQARAGIVRCGSVAPAAGVCSAAGDLDVPQAHMPDDDRVAVAFSAGLAHALAVYVDAVEAAIVEQDGPAGRDGRSPRGGAIPMRSSSRMSQAGLRPMRRL